VVVALEFAVVVSLSSRSVHGGGPGGGGGHALWQVALGCVVVVVVVVVFGVVMALWGHRTYRNLPKGRIFPKRANRSPQDPVTIHMMSLGPYSHNNDMKSREQTTGYSD
jgi:predicted metalloprotease